MPFSPGGKKILTGPYANASDGAKKEMRQHFFRNIYRSVPDLKLNNYGRIFVSGSGSLPNLQMVKKAKKISLL